MSELQKKVQTEINQIKCNLGNHPNVLKILSNENSGDLNYTGKRAYSQINWPFVIQKLLLFTFLLGQFHQKRLEENKESRLPRY